jgi:negative regulator of replication initiation
MRTIRISDEVWDEIAKRGKFGETPDDVLRRVFKISQGDEQIKPRRVKVADRPMRSSVIAEQLTVLFKDDGTSKSWPLPPKDNKQEIRRVRDEAVEFAISQGATDGQVGAVKKALTSNGYHVL